jgi:hypothetical protein
MTIDDTTTILVPTLQVKVSCVARRWPIRT